MSREQIRDMGEDLGKQIMDEAKKQLRDLAHTLLEQALDALLGGKQKKPRRRSR